MPERQRYALFIDGPADGHRMLLAGHEPPRIDVPCYPSLAEALYSEVPDWDGARARPSERHHYVRYSWPVKRGDITRSAIQTKYVLYIWEGKTT